ncbi:MAG: hypothetical protein AAF386_05530 [Pseudomonadota bacterium]
MSKLDRLLKYLGIIWSMAVLFLGVAFFLGGEWQTYKEMKEAYLESSTQDGDISNDSVLRSGDTITLLTKTDVSMALQSDESQKLENEVSIQPYNSNLVAHQFVLEKH